MTKGRNDVRWQQLETNLCYACLERYELRTHSIVPPTSLKHHEGSGDSLLALIESEADGPPAIIQKVYLIYIKMDLMHKIPSWFFFFRRPQHQ